MSSELQNIEASDEACGSAGAAKRRDDRRSPDLLISCFLLPTAFQFRDALFVSGQSTILDASRSCAP
ncbi:MAG TPA: hypothetical protein VFI56_20175 [Vicinamibacterales bacterium]|nr:hypothetical protein [Vicinamibacterales bacterium]